MDICIPYFVAPVPLILFTFHTQYNYWHIVKQEQYLEYDAYTFPRQNTIETVIVGMDLILIRDNVIWCSNIFFLIKQIFLRNDTIFFGCFN